jgi:hypothetical protein
MVGSDSPPIYRAAVDALHGGAVVQLLEDLRLVQTDFRVDAATG